jgi:mannan endo-1,4-beta-mannosidase
MRRDTIGRNGMLDPVAAPISPSIRVPGLDAGAYRVTAWDTVDGAVSPPFRAERSEGGLVLQIPPFAADLALAIRRD